MTAPIISASHLAKKFARNDVLRDINLNIQQGQVVGLLGTNGAGKTTLIKCLLGLLRPTGGHCEIFGENSWNLSAKAKSRLGYVSQEFAVLPWMKVQASTEYVGAFYEHWDYDFVNHLLDEWKLDRSDRVGVLSVGQRQKLAVILAMGHRPELLILDEPVASLDPVARRQFLKSMIEYTSDEKHTIFFSTHITSDLERIATHVAIVQEGLIGYSGELDALKNQVKRLRIRSDKELPADLQVPGTIRSRVEGKHALITVTEMSQTTRDSVTERWQADVDVEDLNLEEIFLELSGTSSEEEITGVRP